ncbi:MAG: tRNA pseudouridine(55) synthase TruB [Clostridiales bacterium]|nr:tRNA pseudouridine(55) synthase TruB [Clostridiales bacterium]
MNGFLSLLKPPGMTSSEAVLAVRKLLPRKTRVGHAGTLDPEAAGVLPIMIGKATRLFDILADKKKEYIAEWIPGLSTDTLDVYGKTVSREPVSVKEEDLLGVLPGLLGDILQVPPMVSALKRDGVRLYDLARAGETVDLPARPVHIDEIRVLRRENDDRAWLKVVCGKGTYIRSLCRDIGIALGCDACMGRLIRTKVGSFDIENSCLLEDLPDGEAVQKFLIPMDEPLMHLPFLNLPEEQEKRIKNGNPVSLALPGMPVGKPIRLYLKDDFCGIGIYDGRDVRFLTMLYG